MTLFEAIVEFFKNEDSKSFRISLLLDEKYNYKVVFGTNTNNVNAYMGLTTTYNLDDAVLNAIAEMDDLDNLAPYREDIEVTEREKRVLNKIKRILNDEYLYNSQALTFSIEKEDKEDGKKQYEYKILFDFFPINHTSFLPEYYRYKIESAWDLEDSIRLAVARANAYNRTLMEMSILGKIAKFLYYSRNEFGSLVIKQNPDNGEFVFKMSGAFYNYSPYFPDDEVEVKTEGSFHDAAEDLAEKLGLNVRLPMKPEINTFNFADIYHVFKKLNNKNLMFRLSPGCLFYAAEFIDTSKKQFVDDEHYQIAHASQRDIRKAILFAVDEALTKINAAVPQNEQT